MTPTDIWRAALSVIADYSPMTYWQMSNGASFWWTLSSRDQLGNERFTDQPFSYAEIVFVCVVNEVRFRNEVISCDWPGLHRDLQNVPGLVLKSIQDFRIAPASPPNQALHLTAAA
jgi:hypothetical protein